MSQCTTLEYKDGSRYCVESENGVLHGYGLLVEPSSVGTFEGLWVKGSQLSGAYTWPNGRRYVGDWKGPFRSGLGVESRPDGTKYSGEFTHNTMGPLGVLSLPTHGLYLGTWAPTGVQEGEGVEAYADGGFYRGQYKNGQRSGYGTRSSSGYEESKEVDIVVDPTNRNIKIHQRPSVASIMHGNSMPHSFHALRRGVPQGQSSSADDLHAGRHWNQIYEGEWANDKRCGHGILKVSDYFTYYGQWKENTRTGYGVLIYERQKGKKKGGSKEEVKEEGLWDNGKLVDPIKHKIKLIRSDLQVKVGEAHQEAIKAATLARDKATIAETKANAAAAKSKVADTRAEEANEHAETASKRVENSAKITKQAIEDARRIKGCVKIVLNEPEISPRSKGRSVSVDDKNTTSYSYLQFTEENFSEVQRASDVGITPTASLHNIQEITGSSLYTGRGSEEFLTT